MPRTTTSSAQSAATPRDLTEAPAGRGRAAPAAEPYVPASLSDARIASMRLRTRLPALSPVQAREAVARMLGAPDWAALRDATGSGEPPSVPDAQVAPDVVAARRAAQAAALVPVIRDLAAAESGTDATGVATADPTRTSYERLLARAIADEVRASDARDADLSPIDWAQRPPIARTDLLGPAASQWWLRWRRQHVVGAEADAQTADDARQAQHMAAIDVAGGSASALLRLARGWGELVRRPGAGDPPPAEAIAFVLDRLAVEYACERARRADAWRDFTERRGRVDAAERERLEQAFDRELWSLACELLSAQPVVELARQASEDPAGFRALAQRGRARFEPGLRSLSRTAAGEN